MPREVAIIGCGMTRFGNRMNESLGDLLKEASTRAIDDAKIGSREIQAVYVSSMLAGEVTNQTAIASALTDELCLFPAAADRIENGRHARRRHQGGRRIVNSGQALFQDIGGRIHDPGINIPRFFERE